MGCRAVLVGSVLAGGVLVGSMLVGPAYAADRTPTPTPGPAQGPNRAPTASLSPPSQQQIDDARNAMERLRHPGTTTPPTLTQIAAPVDPEDRGTLGLRWNAQAWWTLGAGVLVLLVLSETTRISVRRAKHRKGT
jgi:hypothetical protein